MAQALSTQEPCNQYRPKMVSGKALPIPTNNCIGNRMREKMLMLKSFSLRVHYTGQKSQQSILSINVKIKGGLIATQAAVQSWKIYENKV